MRHCAPKMLGIVCLALMGWHGDPGAARAISLDQAGEIKLGARAYTGVRIGTEHTTLSITNNPVSGRQTRRNVTFPSSPAWHVRQHRFFLESEFDHNLQRLVAERVGPFKLFEYLPFKLRLRISADSIPALWRRKTHRRVQGVESRA